MNITDSADMLAKLTAKILEPYEQINQSLFQSINNSFQQISTVLERVHLDYFSSLLKASEIVNESMLSTINSLGSIMESVEIQKSLKNLLMVDESLFVQIQSFDWDRIKLYENSLVSIDGIDYTGEELLQETEKNIIIVEDTMLEQTDKKKAQEFIVALVNIILLLYFNVPQLPECNEFWGEQFAQVKSVIIGEYRIGFTENERNYLRTEANGTAEIIMSLPYDTRVEILDDIPRWYQVKYYDDEKGEIIGWVAKRNIKKEIW